MQDQICDKGRDWLYLGDSQGPVWVNDQIQIARSQRLNLHYLHLLLRKKVPRGVQIRLQLSHERIDLYAETPLEDSPCIAQVYPRLLPCSIR